MCVFDKEREREEDREISFYFPLHQHRVYWDHIYLKERKKSPLQPLFHNMVSAELDSTLLAFFCFFHLAYLVLLFGVTSVEVPSELRPHQKLT